MTALLHGKCRFIQESHIQKLGLHILYSRFCLLLLVADREFCQLLQASGERKQKHSCKYVKCCVYHCNTCRVCRMSHKSKMDEGIQGVEQNHEDNCTNHVKV